MPSSYITKNLLALSLKEIMGKKPLNKISIQNIVDLCGLTRQAFYYHFQDVYELLGWIYNNEAVGFLKKNINYSSWKDSYLEYLNYILENKLFCINTLNSLGRKHIEQFIYTNTSSFFIKIIDELSVGMDIKDKDKQFISDFYIPAFLGLIIKWMEDGLKITPEEMLENVSIIVDGTIYNILKRYQEKNQR